MRTLFLLQIAALGCCLFPPAGSAAPRMPAWDEPGALRFVDGTAGEIISDGEGRALLIPPPAPLPAEAAAQTLPLTSGKLFSGKPYTILAIGDSVTATGPYPEILAQLLGRAAGNRAVKVGRAAYPGRSVDAAVRRWDIDGEPAGADLALIMFGLNDQGAASPVEAYLEQTRWLVGRLHAQGADVVLLEPTPHINITALPGARGEPPADAAIFRTIGFAAALRVLGAELGVPVAPTFDALWGGGANDLQGTARALWPLFPAHYSKPFTSLAETEGRGDTIHPNALGHLRLAQAVFGTLAGGQVAEPLGLSGETRWTDGKLVTRVTIKNLAGEPRAGRVDLYPIPEDDTRVAADYNLAPGATRQVDVVWPGVTKPEDLLAGPVSRVFAGPGPFLQLVDYHDAGSRVRAVRAPLVPDVRWIRERSVSTDGSALARFSVDGQVSDVRLNLPERADVGRIALHRSTRFANAAAELAYVRYGEAKSGEAVADGELTEWDDARWLPVGEPVQARWTSGPVDNRPSPAACYLHWAFKAGAEGVWVAFRGTANFAKDRFTLYFDPREPELLGTAGPYFWVDGICKAAGQLVLRVGDSSPVGVARGLTGVLKFSPDAAGAAGEGSAEFFVPYKVLNTTGWPASADLGVSIVWQHAGEDGRITRLMWSENGHPWNTRWFGVVRRDPAGPLPWMVRVN